MGAVGPFAEDAGRCWLLVPRFAYGACGTALSRIALSLSAALFVCQGGVAQAAGAVLPTPEKVMAGASSTGNDQVWVRVNSQPAGVANERVYGGWSLFYAANDGSISVANTMALLLTAKAANRTLEIQYDVIPTAADFWGFGISRCVLRRVAMN